MTVSTTDLDAVTRGFITAGLWSSCAPLVSDPSGETGGLEYLNADERFTARARELCERFMVKAGTDDLYAFMDAYGDPDGGHPGEYVGHTFYLDAGGSGVSFTDRAWRDDDPMVAVCARLRDAAKAFPEIEWLDIYQTDENTASIG